MSERISVEDTAALLQKADNICILTHQYPDGDTLGSGYALCQALRACGKTVRVDCADSIPEKYAYMTENVPMPAFTPAFVCAVDVADARLLGEGLSMYGDRVDLCIDHHGSNVEYARYLLLDSDSAATAMLIEKVIHALGIALDRPMAECLYTALSTDTGCFRYSNTTPAAHRLAAKLMECGAVCDVINRTMFDMKSRARMELERLALDGMTFYCGGHCAVMVISNEMISRSHAGENDMEGLAPIPRQIEGVWVGVTMRQKCGDSFKISMRTGTHANASAICAKLGGGGHTRAAGCTIELPLQQAIQKILWAIKETVNGI